MKHSLCVLIFTLSWTSVKLSASFHTSAFTPVGELERQHMQRQNPFLATTLYIYRLSIDQTKIELQNELGKRKEHTNLNRILHLIHRLNGDLSQHYVNKKFIHQASEQGQLEVIEALVKAGANLTERTIVFLETPLHIAAHNSNLEVLSFLLKQGVPVNAVDHNQWTPLHLAAAKGHTEAVKILIKERKDTLLNARSDSGATPLLFAAQGKHLDTVDVLLEAGAQEDICDNSGECLASHLSYLSL